MSFIPAQRVVVVMPNWLGDAVMATPFLRALRSLYPAAQVAALCVPIAAPVLAGLPAVDQVRVYSKQESAAALAWLREGGFDLAVLLPNSLRAAMLAFRAGIPRRLGYAREWRSPLLTDRVGPIRKTPEERADWNRRAAARHELERELSGGARERKARRLAPERDYQPIPTIDYYLALAAYLGATALDRRMELAVTSEDENEAAAALGAMRVPGGAPCVVLVPGANFGSSKCWPAGYFAEVAATVARPPYHAHVLIASSPAEGPIVDAILQQTPAGLPVHALARLNGGKGVSLGALKGIVARARLMVANDTGPRHFAAALGTPVVTLFGPTDPRWAETFFALDRQVCVPVPCGPCQLKKCPIDHRCLTGLTPALVMGKVETLWDVPRAAPGLFLPVAGGGRLS